MCNKLPPTCVLVVYWVWIWGLRIFFKIIFGVLCNLIGGMGV